MMRSSKDKAGRDRSGANMCVAGASQQQEQPTLNMVSIVFSPAHTLVQPNIPRQTCHHGRKHYGGFVGRSHKLAILAYIRPGSPQHG